MTTPTRAERNNNFGNLSYIAPPAVPFDGQVGLETGENPNRFGVYSTPFKGARASCEEILKKVLQLGFTTVRLLIEGKPDASGEKKGGWAPGFENADEPYESRVCGTINDAFGIAKDDPGAITPDTDITNAVKDPTGQFLEALSGGIFIVESGRYPINLSQTDHHAAVISAMTARGVKNNGV